MPLRWSPRSLSLLEGKMKSSLRAAAISAAIIGFVGVSALPASAVTTNCPGTAVTTDREFQTDTNPATTCLNFGPGNISGDPNTDPFLQAFAGWMLVDLDDNNNQMDHSFFITGNGTKSGTFSFTGAMEGFKYALGLKSGNGQLDPDYAIFGLNGATSGSWSILNGNQPLAHANLYKMAVDTTAIPLPASLPLLMGGIAGLGFISRRRRAD